MRSHRTTGALAFGLGLLLVTTLGLGSTAAAGSRDPRATTTSTAGARQALEDARTALSGRAGHPTREATLALRDLHRALPGLRGAGRAAAESILARPTDPGDQDHYTVPDETLCAVNICLHWVESTTDAVALTDTSPADGTPDYVALVLATMEQVHSTYVGAGYKAPEPDGTHGGDARTDVYLADVGTDGLYGYCSSDEPVVQGKFDYWAYCVLDNDYSPAEFGSTNTPTENMQVTAAHEYYHAVQAAYDWYEDGWFMEATATWAEDELFDDVDDNVAYLPAGPLGHPEIPLDWYGGAHHYGDWIFFRFLTESFTDEQGGMPTLVRDFWERADSTHGASNDYYSTQAIRSVLASRGYALRTLFAMFAAANNNPAGSYEEGAANAYPLPPYAWPVAQLTPSTRSTGWRKVKLDHLSSATGAFTPSSAMGSGWKLKVKVDMAPKKRGSMAVVTSYPSSGQVAYRFIKLDKYGDGATTVPFTYAGVQAVEVTLVNASDRFSPCWVNSPFSCGGAPKDDGLAQKVNVTAVH